MADIEKISESLGCRSHQILFYIEVTEPTKYCINSSLNNLRFRPTVNTEKLRAQKRLG